MTGLLQCSKTRDILICVKIKHTLVFVVKNNRPVRLCTDLARFGVISQAFLKVLAAVYFGSAAKLADARTRERRERCEQNEQNTYPEKGRDRVVTSRVGRDQGTRLLRRRLKQRLWGLWQQLVGVLSEPEGLEYLEKYAPW